MLYANIEGYERLAGDERIPVQILRDSAALLRAVVHRQIVDSKDGNIDLPAMVAAFKSLISLLETIHKQSLATHAALDRESSKLLATNIGRILAEELKLVPVEVFDRVAARIGGLFDTSL